MSAFDSLFKNDVFMTAFGATVTYSRGEDEADVSAMDSTMSVQQQLDYGASLVIDAKEWQILVSDLTAFTNPQRGDVITDVAGKEWEVAKVGQAPDWEYDADTRYYRIRTQKIGD